MAEGSKTFEGLAAPLLGEFNIQQDNASYDIVTLTGASGTTADFLVCQHSTATTEKVVIGYDGAITTLGAVVGASLDVSGQVEAASLAVTGIGTFDLSAQNTGTASFSVTGLATSDVVVLSPREAPDDACVVHQVAANTLTIRNIASEDADVEFNYLVISKT
jgi:hypothetical protein